MTTKQTDYRSAAETSTALGEKLIRDTEKYQGAIAEFKKHAQDLMTERESLEEKKAALVKLNADYNKAMDDEKQVIPAIPTENPVDVAKSLMTSKSSAKANA